jgi:UDP-glucose:(heptosyl)LPS alpha-1,3-glucosyltransferase
VDIVAEDDSRKLAVVRSSYTPYGGAEIVTLGILEELLKRNVSVHLLTWPNQEWPLHHSRLSTVPLGIPYGNRLWQAWFFEQAVQKYFAAHPFKRIFAIDFVSHFTHVSAAGGSHRTFLKMKNEISSPISRSYRNLSLYHRYTVHVQKKGFTNPLLEKIHCVSKMVAHDIHKDYLVPYEKMQVIYNGVNWEEIGTFFKDRNAVAEEISKRRGLSPEHTYILFLGSGFLRKGLDVAIRGIAHLPESYHLIVVGKDNPRSYIQLASRLHLRDRIHFLGPQEKGWRLASLCKAAVLPSHYEPFGVAAAEAQAMGLPVLVSDKTGYAELILPGKNGIILRRPFVEDAIAGAFHQLRQLIEEPTMSPGEIRALTERLDSRTILREMVDQFLDL